MGWPGRAQRLICRTEAGRVKQAHGACDAHISEDSWDHHHDRDRPRQEHVPPRRLRRARCNHPAAEGIPWSARTPSGQYSALPDRHGGLRKLLCEAHASISVPSTEKCSSDNSGLICGWLRSLVMNLVNTSPFCSRSRFLVKVVGSQIGSSGESPTNQRYKRL